jgi:hypothetical protein
MSMEGFQKAMSDLVASPQLCALLTQFPEEVLGRYDLSDRDRRRLVEVVQQPGMAVNQALYRVNRISPIYSLMPHTCFLLGDGLMGEAIEFWKDFDETRLQFDEEVKKFGNFLRVRIELGLLQNPLLAEVLEYELALNEFRFARRAEILLALRDPAIAADQTNRLGLHPLVRILVFYHEPKQLLQLLDERRSPPYKLAEGEFWLVMDGKGREVEVKLIEPDLGRLLEALEAGIELPLSEDDIEALTEAGLAVLLS